MSTEIIEENKTAGRRSIRKLKKAIKISDPTLAIFYLKQIRPPTGICLSNEIMSGLLKVIHNFMRSGIYIKSEIDSALCEFIKRISAESAELHIRCASLLKSSSDPEYVKFFKNMFGYSKVYSIFKEQTKDLFSETLDPEFLTFMMKLLENPELVYKNLLPVVEKLNLFIKQHTIDKSIIGCCMVISSALGSCGKLISAGFSASLITYLIGILTDPQSFIFISPVESKIMIQTVDSLGKHLENGAESGHCDAKNLSTGMLRMLAENIKAYRASTVYEEIMVVICATACLEPIFALFLKAGNRNPDCLDPELLNFVVFDRSVKQKNELDEEDIKDSVKKQKSNGPKQRLRIEFQRPFKHHYDAQYQSLRDDFIVFKYKFLDVFWEFTNRFERVEFLNNLALVEQTHRLFAVLNNLKKKIEWSDLIVYACNAPDRSQYIPFIFDECFIKNNEHQVFLDIFLEALVNTDKSHGRDLVYLTRYAIDVRHMHMLARLYIIGLDKEDNFSKKRRELIIRFIASLGAPEENDKSGDEVTMLRSKTIGIHTDEKELENNLVEKIKKIEIKEVVDKKMFEVEREKVSSIKQIRLAISKEAEVFVEALSHHLNVMHYNLGPLLVVLASKKYETEVLEKYLECLNRELNKHTEKFDGEETVISIFAIFCVLYDYWYFDKHEIMSSRDIYIVVMSVRIAELHGKNVKDIKSKAFDRMVKLNPEEFVVARNLMYILDEDHEQNNEYVKCFNKIISILADR